MTEQSVVQLQQDAVQGMFAGLGVGSFIIALAVYVFMAWCIARIAKRLGMEFGSSFVWALIPIANIFLFLKLAAKPMWWFILLLIPVVNLVICILAWIGLVERLGKPAWWGVVIALVPIVNVVLFLILVFEKPQSATV